MAVTKAKSGLMQKYGAKLNEAVKKHGADETDYGQMRLPPGINNGVAQLDECKFDVYKSGDNAGEYYFLARGIIMQPYSVNTKDGEIKVMGLHTMIMEPVCDTKTKEGKVTTQEQHISNILNEMRKLGADTKGVGVEELEAIAADLRAAKPYFRFSTSQGAVSKEYPDPKIWENWYGNKGLENYTPPSAEQQGGQPMERDNSAPGSSVNGQALGEQFSEFDDLTSLAQRADAKDEEAQVKLEQLARASGLTDEHLGAAGNWAEVVEMINHVQSEAAAAEAPAEQLPEPSIGEVWKYHPTNPVTKNRSDKPVDCEVLAVNKLKKTADLQNAVNRKAAPYKGVPFAEMMLS
jgi:hypothetical protein